MISFEEAGAILDEAADELPREIFEKLNGGVNLLPATKTDDNGLLVMGMYFYDQMGRHVELYYGSFCEAFPDASPDKCRRELIKTLKHELTHHVENLAWDRSLEKWDDQHTAELLSGLCDEPLEANSVLFVDMDDSALAPMAEALFRLAAAGRGPDIRSASAGIAEKQPEHVSEKAARAAEARGASIASHVPSRVTRAMMDSYELILCMTEEQGDELALIYPACDERIICLGEKDITPPLLGGQGGWNRLAERVAGDVAYLVDELCGGREDADPS